MSTTVAQLTVAVTATGTSKTKRDIDGVSTSTEKARKKTKESSDDMVKSHGKVSKSASGMSTALGAIGGAAAAYAVVGVMEEAVAEAEDAKVSQEKLGQVMKSMGYAQHTAAVQDYANTLGQKIAIDNDDIAKTQAKIATFASLGQTAGKTGGYFNRVTEAAYNLSALGFGSAEDAAVMLSKAMNSPEQAAALSRTGALTKAEAAHAAELAKTGKTEEARAFIMAAVEKQVSGAAEKNVTGIQKTQVASAALKEQLGTALLPVVAKMADVFGKVAEWMGKHPGLVKILVPVIGALAAIIGIATIAIWLMNAALWANPITWIVAAIVGLIVVVVVMYNKFEWFRNLVKLLARVWVEGFKGIIAIAKWLWEGLKKIWDVLVSAFNWVKDNWSKIGMILGGPIVWAAKWLIGHWDSVMAFFKSIPGKLATLGKTIVNVLTWPFRTAFNAISKLWNATIGKFRIEIPSWIPLFGGKTFEMPQMPELQALATGGTVTSAGAFLVGERGPEVVNLPRGAAVTPNGGGGATYIINVEGTGLTQAQVRAQFDAAMDARGRANVLRTWQLGGLPA